MVGTNGTNKQVLSEDATYLKKIRKPLIEKRRRERMNRSITQLRALVESTVNQSVPPMTRIDKADILELTVRHIEEQCQGQRVAMATNDVAPFAAGFQDCAREVATFLASNGLIDEYKIADLRHHLQNQQHRTLNQSRQFVSSGNPRVSTPHRPDTVRNMMERTPFQLRKLSPIQPESYTSCVGHTGNRPQHRSFSNNSVDSQTGNRLQDRCFDISLRSDFSATASNSPLSRLSSPMYSVAIPSNSSTSSSNDSSSFGSMLSSTDDSTESCHDVRGMVAIGTGSDNQVGHVISSPIWRPW